MTFDPKCLDLAIEFLEDEAGINSPSMAEDLAATIQNTIENWIEEQRLRSDPA